MTRCNVVATLLTTRARTPRPHALHGSHQLVVPRAATLTIGGLPKRYLIIAFLAVMPARPALAQDVDRGWAAYELGVFYELGRGVWQDEGQAAYWFQQGALGGHRPSQAKFSRYERFLP
jgi:hypothetical protein